MFSFPLGCAWQDSYFKENIFADQSSCLKGNLPLFLPCGHSVCENCIRSLTKFQEPIECKICLRSMELKAGDILTLARDKSSLYQLFPVNYQILGELTLQLIMVTENNLLFIFINVSSLISLMTCFIPILSWHKRRNINPMDSASINRGNFNVWS